MSRVVDYAWARPTIARLRGLGSPADPVVGVMRYVSSDASKNLSTGEYAALKAAHLAVGLVWENTAGAALGGSAQGLRDAQRANALADSLGFPKTAPIYYAVDFEATNAQMPKVLDYLRGARSARGRQIGVYGSYAVLEAASRAGAADYFWQTSAWSYGKLSAHRDLYQHTYNNDTDISEVNSADWGQDTYKVPAVVTPRFPLDVTSSVYAYGPDSQRGCISGAPNGDAGLRLWQSQMVRRGWTLTVDGIYGPETDSVATAFQREKGLTVNGFVNLETWNAAWKAQVT